jgi:hypothetical protein
MQDRRSRSQRGQHAGEAHDRQQAEPASTLPTLPLGGAAFSSPLHPTAPAAAVRRNRNRRAALALVAASALLSGTVVALALVVRAGRSAPSPSLSREPRPAVAQVSSPAPPAARTIARPMAAARVDPHPQRTGAIVVPPGRLAASSAPVVGGQRTPPQALQRSLSARQPPPEARRERNANGRKAARESRRAARERVGSDLPLQPSRAQVIAAMRRITPAVHACFGRRHGKAMVRLTVIGRTGRVTTARVTGQRGAIGSCIARAVRRARLPVFAQRRLQIAYPFAR